MAFNSESEFNIADSVNKTGYFRSYPFENGWYDLWKLGEPFITAKGNWIENNQVMETKLSL